MSKKYIVAIDLGTTGNRVFLFDTQCKEVASSYKEFTQIYPKAGWVEHDPLEIWESVVSLIQETLQKCNLDSSHILTIGITNQRETTVLWDKESGTPVHNAIVWQCRRTTPLCNRLIEEGHSVKVQRTTGLVIDAYFSATKIRWMLDNVGDAKALASKGSLLFGTIDTWILWKLTGGKSHITDYTNASRTMLFNINTLEWDDAMLSMLDLPKNILPEVQPSISKFGTTQDVPGLKDGIVIGGIAGDQQSALVGQNCVFPGSIKNTYGTGCFILQNIGSRPLFTDKGLITTIACNEKGEAAYALEGSVFIAGAVVQWLRDYMHFFENASESETLALSASDESDIVFVPAFTGLGAPYWDGDVRGAIFGLTRDTSPAHITKAALQSIALQSYEVIQLMYEESGTSLSELKVDGGAVSNSFLMQYQADILDKPVIIPQNSETTVLGAAYLAAVTSGLFQSTDEVAHLNHEQSRFLPKMESTRRADEIAKWKRAVSTLLHG